jgi:hypothetical protein
MRTDTPDLKWLIPSVLLLSVLGWQFSAGNQAGLNVAASGLASVFESLDGVGRSAWENVHRLDVLPALSDGLAVWLVPVMLGVMLLVGVLNAIRQNEFTRSERTPR